MACVCNASGTCWGSSSRNGSLLLIYLTGMMLRKVFQSLLTSRQFGKVGGWLICNIFHGKNSVSAIILMKQESVLLARVLLLFGYSCRYIRYVNINLPYAKRFLSFPPHFQVASTPFQNHKHQRKDIFNENLL